MTEAPQLEKRVAEWCNHDRDEETLAVIRRLVEEKDEKELEARLSNRKSAMVFGHIRFRSLSIQTLPFNLHPRVSLRSKTF